jgi:hypothetical protein
VSHVLHVSPETSGEQKLVVWHWSGACIIADGSSYVPPLAPK